MPIVVYVILCSHPYALFRTYKCDPAYILSMHCVTKYKSILSNLIH
ncbi:hypothetical protein VAE151_160009 [Vibrio aestuarianus]|nr:hypothetical protein VAE151_160009 [Vibrio aestuarianus]